MSPPAATLDERFSSPGAAPTPWETVEAALQAAEVFSLSTVRADGRPHVTPLLAVWHGSALYFCTGTGEQKYRNLESNPRCILTTGTNAFRHGLDVVVEGDAVRCTDEALLQQLAALWLSKFDWRFEVRDGAFREEHGEAHVFEVRPAKVLAFAKGEPYSQTRYRFDRARS